MFARIASAWTAAIAAWETVDWAKNASMVAFFYTLGLLIEWWWKRLGRPFAESQGWVKRRYRRRSDFEHDHEDSEQGEKHGRDDC